MNIQELENLKIYKNGECISALSPFMVVQQNITNEEIEYLKSLHILKDALFEYMEDLNVETNLRKLHIAVKCLELIEFRMQEKWHFEQDANKHSWWFQVPHCTCPVDDNWERWFGNAERVVNQNCPLHGNMTTIPQLR